MVIVIVGTYGKLCVTSQQGELNDAKIFQQNEIDNQNLFAEINYQLSVKSLFTVRLASKQHNRFNAISKCCLIIFLKHNLYNWIVQEYLVKFQATNEIMIITIIIIVFQDFQ